MLFRLPPTLASAGNKESVTSMTLLNFQFADTPARMLLSSLPGLLVAAGCTYKWLHRRPTLSTRKVRVTRDYPPHRR